MTRFADIRATLTKRTDDMDYVYFDEAHRLRAATPRLVSPFKPGGYNLRDDVDEAEFLHPAHNRASRRAAGNRRTIRHGRRWRTLQRALKDTHRQAITAARNAEGTEAA